MEILIVTSQSAIYDIRVDKIAKSLSKRYPTSILGWNREGIPKKVLSDYPIENTLFDLRAPYGRPVLVLYMPFFWIWALVKLISYRPKIVHSCNLDTVLPCYLYKLIFRRRLVFDVFDRYAMVNIPKKLLGLYSIVNWSEEFFCKRVDFLITVSEKLLGTFRHLPKDHALIMNCPDDTTEMSGVDRLKPTHDASDTKVRIVYAGVIIRYRGIENMVLAIKDLKDVDLIVAGRVYDQELLHRITQLPNVRYEGILLPREALSLERQADIMFALYDLNLPINNFAMPNKMFESMMFGVPLITNLSPDFVKRIEFGITVEYDNITQIRSAVIKLRDNLALRKTLGTNGRKAFLEKYNWGVMEKELYKVYDKLLQDCALLHNR